MHAIVERAVRRYARECSADGALFEQPSADSNYDPTTETVELVNVRGTLARYQVLQTERGPRLRSFT